MIVISILTLILFFLWFLVGSTFMLVMLCIALVGLFIQMVSSANMDHRSRKGTKMQKEQLDILKLMAKKEGIELPEPPTPWHQKQVDLPSLNLGINSLFAEDKGEDFRKQFLVEPTEISEEEKKIRKQLGMMG